MSGTIRSSLKFSGTSINQSGSSMHFWGVCCESGKQYAQVVGQRFRITMAVLDPKSFHNESNDKIVSLIVLRSGIEYLLCVLKHGEIHQVNLNLIFDKGENVKFYINGHGKVYLSGYQLTDSEGDVMNDENGYLCPLVEVESRNKKITMDRIPQSSSEVEPVASTSKKNKVTQPLWSSYICDLIADDVSDSESDEDFAASDEDTDDEEISDEIEPGELEDLTRDLLESDIGNVLNDDEIQNDSRKRRRHEISSSQKRSRNDSQHASTSVDNSEDVICIDDNELYDISSSFNATSAGNTPMPKKHRNSETPFGEKMSKKEKKLREILKNIGEYKRQDQVETSTPRPSLPSTSKSPMSVTPKSPVSDVTNSTKRTKNPLIRLEGGVEIQDIIVGKGPEATNGKMLHIFFVGRLPDNRIFDARVPGNKAFSFRLGAGEVIKGWEIALQGMKVGGRRKMKIPATMARGAVGNSSIPKDCTLRFVVDLQSVN